MIIKNDKTVALFKQILKETLLCKRLKSILNTRYNYVGIKNILVDNNIIIIDMELQLDDINLGSLKFNIPLDFFDKNYDELLHYLLKNIPLSNHIDKADIKNKIKYLTKKRNHLKFKIREKQSKYSIYLTDKKYKKAYKQLEKMKKLQKKFNKLL